MYKLVENVPQEWFSGGDHRDQEQDLRGDRDRVRRGRD